MSFWLLSPPRTVFSFSVGVLVWRLHKSGRLKATPQVPSWTLIVALSVMLLAPLPLQPTIRDVLIIAIAWPALLTLAVHASPPTRLHGTASFLGRLSYPLYAVHAPIVALGSPLILMPGELGAVRALLCLPVIVAAIALAMIVERFVERPLALGQHPKPAAAE